MSHTPGPWFDDGCRIYAPTDDKDKRNGRVIVEYKHIEDFNPDDASLITSSPKMLEALIGLLRAMRQCPNGIDKSQVATIAEAENVALRVIAEADASKS